MRALLAFLVLLVPLTALAGNAAAILEGLPTVISGCEAPKDGIKTYEDAQLGASRRYERAGLTGTVYAYNLGHENIADGIDDVTVQKAFSSAGNEIHEAAKLGYYSNVEERDKGTATFDGRTLLRSRYRLTREKGEDAGKRFFSEIHVFGAQGNIIKTRFTGTLENEDAHEKAIESFIIALMDQLKRPASPQRK